jgi:hypothetical protein
MTQKKDLVLKVREELRASSPLSLNQLKRATKAADWYAVKRAVSLLEALDLVEVRESKDAFGTKLVSLKKCSKCGAER